MGNKWWKTMQEMQSTKFKVQMSKRANSDAARQWGIGYGHDHPRPIYGLSTHIMMAWGSEGRECLLPSRAVGLVTLDKPAVSRRRAARISSGEKNTPNLGLTPAQLVLILSHDRIKRTFQNINASLNAFCKGK